MSGFGLEFDAMVRQMVGMGIPRQKAEHAAGLAVANTRRQPGDDRPAQVILGLPVTILVPWSCLVSDDAKYAPTIRAGHPLLILKAPYREAKGKIRNLARLIARDALPADGDLELVATFTLPDRRIHDITNFAKIVCDALEGVIYNNDSQLVRTVWEKAGTDIDAPRAEITVSRR